MNDEIEAAIYAGDQDRLWTLAPCRCCCHDHTFRDCPARRWHGCRGQGSEQYDSETWFKFYAAYRGMTEAEFYGWSE